ncbi:phage tail protein [Acinetobacter towneri]|uniref:phage tail protein n=1 Tax=Acinetobacter towneri TaxID=202956 RepID=UPI003A87D598
MSQYYNIKTNAGDAAIATALANNTKLNITHVAFGDGGGSVPNPSKNLTSLINEVHRQAVNKYTQHPTITKWLTVEAIIPSNIGGFWIREIGVIADGVLISHGSHAPFFKVADTEGVSEYRLKFTIDIQDASIVQLTLDESLIYASQAWVNENYIPRADIVNNLTTADATKPLSAAQGKVLQDNKLGKTDNAVSATKLQTSRTIGGVAFDGTTNIDLPGVNTAGNQNTSGNAATATKLQTSRTIGGVAFDGTTNIDLPGVNTAGNQNTSGNAATATKLQTSRTIGGVAFDGTTNIDLPGVNIAGNQNTSGNAATATKLQTARNIAISSEGSFNHTSTNFDGSSNVSMNLNPKGVKYPANIKDNFRAATKGDTAIGDYINLGRSDEFISDFCDQDSPSLNFGSGDTHAYISVSYSFRRVFIGGGSENKLNWTGELALKDSNVASATKLQIPRNIAISSDGSFSHTSTNFDGSSNVSMNLNPKGVKYPANIKDNFRAATKGDTAIGDYINLGRSDEFISDFCDPYSPSLNFGSGDTHAYISVSYSFRRVFIGGGSENKLNWTGELALKDSNVASATKLQTARTISIVGAVQGSAVFDGSGDISINTSSNHGVIRAYANFNGASNYFRKNVGIASIENQGSGRYLVTLSNAAPDANYIVQATCSHAGNDAGSVNLDPTFAQTVNQFRLRCNFGGDNTVGSFAPEFLNILITY